MLERVAGSRAAGWRLSSSAVCLGGGRDLCMLRVIMVTCALLEGSSCKAPQCGCHKAVALGASARALC
jgi:hypothetical protein